MKILCVWELGGNLGHVTKLSTIASELCARGYEVTVALKELQSAYRVFQGTPVTFLQAPVWLGPRPPQRHVVCIADILRGLGYDDPDSLMGLVVAWRGLFNTVQPDLVIFDYAPTALLAARDMRFKKIGMGIGYGELPYGVPAINLRPGEVVPRSEISAREAGVVETINTVAHRLGVSPVNVISELYKVDRTVLNTIPELDLYSDHRVNVSYCPTGHFGDRFQPAVWPESSQPKVFAYLSLAPTNSRIVLEALARVDVNCLVFLRGATPSQLSKYREMGLTVFDHQFDMQSVLRQVDVVVAHGGNTVLEGILAGKPILAVPMQLEQRNTACRIESQGLGFAVGRQSDVESIVRKLQSLLQDKTIESNVRRVAEQYVTEDGSGLEALVVETCDNLLLQEDKPVTVSVAINDASSGSVFVNFDLGSDD